MLSLVFVGTFRITLLKRNPIVPKQYTTIAQGRTADITIDRIYQNDLFDTYKKEVPPAAPVDVLVTIPEPPPHIPPTLPSIVEPQFLDPLNITLKGIMVVGADPAKSNAFIVDNKSGGIEKIYRVGDQVEDATLVRILNNKIILLRSNGQQEVIYLRAEDAQKDSNFITENQWDKVITPASDNAFYINTDEFIKHISNLGQFIDMLHLTTAYQKGKSIGCRIGALDEKSFGAQIGLINGDIVTRINDIETGLSENRLQIYQNIIALPDKSPIKIVLLRAGTQKTITLIIKKPSISALPANESQLDELTLQKQKNDERINILKEKYIPAPTLQDIRKRERKNMLEREGLPKKNLSSYEIKQHEL